MSFLVVSVDAWCGWFGLSKSLNQMCSFLVYHACSSLRTCQEVQSSAANRSRSKHKTDVQEVPPSHEKGPRTFGWNWFQVISNSSQNFADFKHLFKNLSHIEFYSCSSNIEFYSCSSHIECYSCSSHIEIYSSSHYNSLISGAKLADLSRPILLSFGQAGRVVLSATQGFVRDGRCTYIVFLSPSLCASCMSCPARRWAYFSVRRTSSRILSLEKGFEIEMHMPAKSLENAVTQILHSS